MLVACPCALAVRGPAGGGGLHFEVRWLADTCHSGAPAAGCEAARAALEKSATNFRNNLARIDYAGLPLGSGVTEAGCKLLVKKRLCARECRGGSPWPGTS